VTAPTPLPAMPIGVQQGASSVESQTGSPVVEPVPLLTVTAGGQTGAGIIMEPVPVSAVSAERLPHETIVQKQVPVGAQMAASYAAAAGSTSAVSAAPPRISNHADPPQTLVGISAPGPSYVGAGSPVMPSPQAMVPTPVVAMTAGGGAPRATSASQVQHSTVQANASQPKVVLPQMQTLQPTQAVVSTQQSVPNGQTGPTKVGGPLVTEPAPAAAAATAQQLGGSVETAPLPMLAVSAGQQRSGAIVIELMPVSAAPTVQHPRAEIVAPSVPVSAVPAAQQSGAMIATQPVMMPPSSRQQVASGARVVSPGISVAASVLANEPSQVSVGAATIRPQLVGTPAVAVPVVTPATLEPQTGAATSGLSPPVVVTAVLGPPTVAPAALGPARQVQVPSPHGILAVGGGPSHVIDGQAKAQQAGVVATEVPVVQSVQPRAYAQIAQQQVLTGSQSTTANVTGATSALATPAASAKTQVQAQTLHASSDPAALGPPSVAAAPGPPTPAPATSGPSQRAEMHRPHVAIARSTPTRAISRSQGAAPIVRQTAPLSPVVGRMRPPRPPTEGVGASSLRPRRASVAAAAAPPPPSSPPPLRAARVGLAQAYRGALKHRQEESKGEYNGFLSKFVQ